MSVTTIYQDSEGQIFTEGRHLAIKIDGKVYATLHDPALCTGLSERQLLEAAVVEGKVLAPRLKRKIDVCFPTLAEAMGEWPEARVVKSGKYTQMPRATTVHWRSPGGKRAKTPFRSMQAVRDALGLTKPQFEAIANKSPGFRDQMLHLMSGIEVHPSGYKHKHQTFVANKAGGILFKIKETKTGFTITYLGPRQVKKIDEIPFIVITNSILE